MGSSASRRVEGQPGALVATLDRAGAATMNDGLRALADAGVPIVAFELEGARLSDAFLAMTGEPSAAAEGRS